MSRKRTSRKTWRKKQVQEKEAWKKSVIPFGPGVRGKVTGGYESPRLVPPPPRPDPVPPEPHAPRVIRVPVPVTQRSPRKNPGAPPRVTTATKGSNTASTYSDPPVTRVPGGFGRRTPPASAGEPSDERSDDVGRTTDPFARQEPLCPITLEPCWRVSCTLWNLVTGSCCFRAQVDYLSHVLGRMAPGGSRSSSGMDPTVPEAGAGPSPDDPPGLV
jgi:hypothetical protein